MTTADSLQEKLVRANPCPEPTYTDSELAQASAELRLTLGGRQTHKLRRRLVAGAGAALMVGALTAAAVALVPDQVAEKFAGFKGINVHDVHLLAGQTLADGDRIEIWVGTGENGQHCEYTRNLPKNGPEDGETECYTGDGHGPDGLVLDKNWQGSSTTLPGLVAAYGHAHSPDAVSALISGPSMAPLTVAFNPGTRYAV